MRPTRAKTAKIYGSEDGRRGVLHHRPQLTTSSSRLHPVYLDCHRVPQSTASTHERHVFDGRINAILLFSASSICIISGCSHAFWVTPCKTPSHYCKKDGHIVSRRAHDAKRTHNDGTSATRDSRCTCVFHYSTHPFVADIRASHDGTCIARRSRGVARLGRRCSGHVKCWSRRDTHCSRSSTHCSRSSARYSHKYTRCSHKHTRCSRSSTRYSHKHTRCSHKHTRCSRSSTRYSHKYTRCSHKHTRCSRSSTRYSHKYARCSHTRCSRSSTHCSRSSTRCSRHGERTSCYNYLRSTCLSLSRSWQQWRAGS
ncbi:hypothetical protein PTSG_02979 [Salpingoeca rosetta]|uniref:Uncharacterized protein n=1 Tax=Salpingoeca rosetta (strain ATCC 50818 / BSB-021) TaxID=946362 RepID=F2U3W8_SALR5|nr:uncharacterized protein PTSG_02979 [Salpingoeca rosetta]EGD82312.1 hypothetical protein PTSG_02979 [Salpingoeca rosetta]|eukprot:XP_004996495.1 hypothetical protein PTSG_02979 [Salpingoeca rosetta]